MTEDVNGALQFDRAEYMQPEAQAVCARCSNAISQSYYEVNGAILCGSCREKHDMERSGSGAARLARALLAGLGAAIAGSVIYWAVRAATGYELGIISIAVGFTVGKAVNWGSRGRGGRTFQLLAIFLTYISICGNYIPDIVKEVLHQPANHTSVTSKTGTTAVPSTNAKSRMTADPKAKTSVISAIGTLFLAAGALIVLAAIAPFLQGFQNAIGLFIIALGLWEAWKLNRLRDDVVTGPYQITPAAPFV